MVPPRFRGRTFVPRWKIPLAVVLAGVVLISGLLVLGPFGNQIRPIAYRTPPTLRGPAVTVHSFTLQNGVATPVGGANVTIMSPDPNAASNPAWAGINISSAVTPDAGEIPLLNGGTGTNGSFEGNLPASFATIAREWTTHLYPGSHLQNVSLQIYAVYANVSRAGVQSVYSYSDNIVYDPWSPPATFSLSVAFDVTHPMWTSGGGGQGPSTGGRSPAMSPEGSRCPTNEVKWVLLGTTNDTGPYPVALANNSDPTATNDYLALVGPASRGTWSVDWNSITVSGTTRDVQMSSTPSYTGTGSAYPASSPGCAANYLSSASTCMIDLQAVTMWTFRFQMQVLYHSGYTCQAYSSKFNYLTMEILKINGGPNGTGGNALYSLHAGGENSYFGDLLQRISDRDQAFGYTGPLGPTNFTPLSTMEGSATQYSNAGRALTNFTNASSYFDSALGLGLAAIDAANLCGAECSAAAVPTILGLLSATAGFASGIYPSMSSLSLAMTNTLYLGAQVLTNAKWALDAPGATYRIFLNESASAVQLSCGVDTYYPQMPGLMSIACPYGASPGAGC